MAIPEISCELAETIEVRPLDNQPADGLPPDAFPVNPGDTEGIFYSQRVVPPFDTTQARADGLDDGMNAVVNYNDAKNDLWVVATWNHIDECLILLHADHPLQPLNEELILFGKEGEYELQGEAALNGLNFVPLNHETNAQINNAVTLVYGVRDGLTPGINFVEDYDHSLIIDEYYVSSPSYPDSRIVFTVPDGTIPFWMDPSIDYAPVRGLYYFPLDILAKIYPRPYTIATDDFSQEQEGAIYAMGCLDPDNCLEPPIPAWEWQPAQKVADPNLTQRDRIGDTDFYIVEKTLVIPGTVLDNRLEVRPEWREILTWVKADFNMPWDVRQAVRRMIGDASPPYYFSNSELDTFWGIECQDRQQTAALALETWAARIAYDEGAFQAGGISVNGPAMAQEKRQRANELRMQFVHAGYAPR